MKTARVTVSPDSQGNPAPHRSIGPESRRSRYAPAGVLIILLTAFLALHWFLPLKTAVKIGADEGYETAKATLWFNGYQLYTEIWNDQPPLHTFLITQIIKHVSLSVLGPRLLTVAFSLLLLASLFLASLRVSGLLAAGLATAFVIASPGFLELSCSVMQEIPALAPAVAALSVLLIGPRTRWTELVAGVLFALALQLKFIGAIYLPLAGLILWLRYAKEPPQSFIIALLILGAGLCLTFVALDVLVSPGSFWLQLKQSWAAHFAATQSFEYGSPSEHPFEWGLLLRNWDLTVPAVLGVILCLRRYRETPLATVPAIWLALTLLVFGIHKPWWSYYYVHTAVPLCWCAAIGIQGIVRWLQPRRRIGWSVLFASLGLAAGVWMGARLYLEAEDIRHLPQTYSSLVLNEIARLKPFTKFLYTDEPVYSFHTGIPVPPRLAVVSLKRFWSGDLTNAKLAQELQTVKPGLMLLNATTQELPYQDLLRSEYRLIYEDSAHRLYAHKTVLAQARQARSGK